MAVGDLFNDGKLDVVINALDGYPALLRNVAQDSHHWIELKLVGGAKSPRDTVGVTVYLTTGGKRQRGDVISGASYASTHDPRIHFGLGDATTIDLLEVHWPSGAKETFPISKIDQIFILIEGKGTKP
jgi:enediyne biosynthesis protein E4